MEVRIPSIDAVPWPEPAGWKGVSITAYDTQTSGAMSARGV